MNVIERAQLQEIMRLLDEALEHALKLDGHCKSSEGYVSICYGTSFERFDGEDPMKIKSVKVYSYRLGPHRNHYFDSVREALDEVRRWHRETMALTAEDYGGFWGGEP